MSEKGKGSGDNFHKVPLRVPVFVFCLAAMFGSNWHCQKPLVGAMSGRAVREKVVVSAAVAVVVSWQWWQRPAVEPEAVETEVEICKNNSSGSCRSSSSRRSNSNSNPKSPGPGTSKSEVLAERTLKGPIAEKLC